MRILAITNLFPNSRQPHRASFNLRQFAALAREHEVRIIAPVAWTTSLRRVNPGVHHSPFAPNIEVEHPRYLFTPRVFRGRYGQMYAQSIRRSFLAAVRDFSPDVVLGSWAYPDGWVAVALAREAGLPVAIKVHGSDLMMVAPTGPTASRYCRTSHALRSADAVIAVGRHLRDRAVLMGADPCRTHIVPNGVDTRIFHPGDRSAARARLGLPAMDPMILSVGNLVTVKGHDVLFHALGLLDRAGCAFHSVCIGDGPLRGKLLGQLASLHLSSRVTLAGSKPQHELADWYRAADLVVLPSRSEGVPNVLLEASACGASIVASDVGGVADIVDTDGLVPPGDPSALAARIRAFLDAGTHRASNPRPTPADWDSSARALAQVLRNIARNTAVAERRVAA